VAAPSKPTFEQNTIADCRRILHTARVMQMNTARTARELYALGRLEVWMRGNDHGAGMKLPSQLELFTDGARAVSVLGTEDGVSTAAHRGRSRRGLAEGAAAV
jgi:hypothetical protein